MAKFFDRVKVNIATTGTGTITFGSRSSNAFQLPSEAGAIDGDTPRYVIVDGTDFEEGLGTIASSVATMVRTTVTRSSVGGVVGTSKLNLSGSANLSFSVSAADLLDKANNLADLPSAATALSNLGGAAKASNLSDLAAKYTAKDNLSVHGADIASTATLDLESATGDVVDVTGNNAITAITLAEGHERTVRFTGTPTLTNGASLVLPGAANIVAAVGDMAVFRGYASSVVRCVSYSRVSGKPVKAPASADISDATTVGKALLTATDADAARVGALALGVIRVQKFTSSGTYTPNANMVYCIAEAVGAGGAGGSITGLTSLSVSAGGGGAGAFTSVVLSAADIGASKAVAIGAGGASAAAGSNTGGTGGTTTLGSTLLVANGGVGGGSEASSSIGGTGGSASTNGFVGAAGEPGMQINSSTLIVKVNGGRGANTVWGSGGSSSFAIVSQAVNGAAATGYGAGGQGAAATIIASTAAGGAGAPGYLRITEFCTK